MSASYILFPFLLASGRRPRSELVCMLASSYNYAGIPWEFVVEAVKVKTGYVPILGLNHIVWLNSKFPTLGLEREANRARPRRVFSRKLVKSWLSTASATRDLIASGMCIPFLWWPRAARIARSFWPLSSRDGAPQEFVCWVQTHMYRCLDHEIQ